MPDQMWIIWIGIGVPYYTLVLAKLCYVFVPSVLSRFFSEISISHRLHRNKTSFY